METIQITIPNKPSARATTIPQFFSAHSPYAAIPFNIKSTTRANPVSETGSVEARPYKFILTGILKSPAIRIKGDKAPVKRSNQEKALIHQGNINHLRLTGCASSNSDVKIDPLCSPIEQI